MRPAGRLVDHVLDLVCRSGDGFPGELLLATGEVEVDGAPGGAAFFHHIGEGGGVVAAQPEQLAGGVDHPGAAVSASGHGSNPRLTMSDVHHIICRTSYLDCIGEISRTAEAVMTSTHVTRTADPSFTPAEGFVLTGA